MISFLKSVNALMPIAPTVGQLRRGMAADAFRISRVFRLNVNVTRKVLLRELTRFPKKTFWFSLNKQKKGFLLQVLKNIEPENPIFECLSKDRLFEYLTRGITWLNEDQLEQLRANLGSVQRITRNQLRSALIQIQSKYI